MGTDTEAARRVIQRRECRRRDEREQLLAAPASLGGFETRIKEHWQTHRPQMAAALEAGGRLDQAVRSASMWTLDAEAAAIRSGLTPDQARELTREAWAFLPEEEELDHRSDRPEQT